MWQASRFRWIILIIQAICVVAGLTLSIWQYNETNVIVWAELSGFVFGLVTTIWIMVTNGNNIFGGTLTILAINGVTAMFINACCILGLHASVLSLGIASVYVLPSIVIGIPYALGTALCWGFSNDIADKAILDSDRCRWWERIIHTIPIIATSTVATIQIINGDTFHVYDIVWIALVVLLYIMTFLQDYIYKSKREDFSILLVIYFILYVGSVAIMLTLNILTQPDWGGSWFIVIFIISALVHCTAFIKLK